VREAIRYYESVGGTASIFINDDGMQVIDPDVAEYVSNNEGGYKKLTIHRARRQYYHNNHIGWCSRPAHGHEGFLRKGRFKKASNMNYCLDFSNKVEDELLGLIAQREETINTQHITLEEENALYEQALETVIAGDEGRTMAAGNVRLGEIILLIDCDTRVVSFDFQKPKSPALNKEQPETCLYMGALEMIECPDIAIIQHTSGVLRVAHNLFETGSELSS
jgi:hypothetical protein